MKAVAANGAIVCSFCGLDHNDERIAHMIAGPVHNGYQVAICSGCVSQCIEAIFDRAHELWLESEETDEL